MIHVLLKRKVGEMEKHSDINKIEGVMKSYNAFTLIIIMKP